MGATPILSRDDHHRGIEIKQYLDAHPEIEKFVILDDNCDCIEKADFVPVSVNPYNVTGDFIETNPDSGLTVTQALHASWSLGLNKRAIEANKQYQEDLDTLLGCMI